MPCLPFGSRAFFISRSRFQEVCLTYKAVPLSTGNNFRHRLRFHSIRGFSCGIRSSGRYYVFASLLPRAFPCNTNLPLLPLPRLPAARCHAQSDTPFPLQRDIIQPIACQPPALQKTAAFPLKDSIPGKRYPDRYLPPVTNAVLFFQKNCIVLLISNTA